MAKFIARLFGGGKKQSTPAASPVQSIAVPTQSTKSKQLLAAASTQKQRIGKARNRSIFTSVLGIDAEQKTGLIKKKLTGA